MAGLNWSRCLGCVAILGLSALLGACGPSKTEVAARDEESRLLREKQAEIDTRISGIEGNVNALSSQITTMKTQPPPVNFEPRNDDGGSRATRTSGSSGRRVDLGTSLFNPGSDQLTAAGKKSVDGAVKGISKGASITVEGFADTAPIKKSKFPSNQALSEARARSVAAYLRGKGFSIADSVGMGSVSSNGKAPSRRVELVVAE